MWDSRVKQDRRTINTWKYPFPQKDGLKQRPMLTEESCTSPTSVRTQLGEESPWSCSRSYIFSKGETTEWGAGTPRHIIWAVVVCLAGSFLKENSKTQWNLYRRSPPCNPELQLAQVQSEHTALTTWHSCVCFSFSPGVNSLWEQEENQRRRWIAGQYVGRHKYDWQKKINSCMH